MARQHHTQRPRPPYRKKSLDGLTRRERAILDLWDAGLSFDRIASELGITRAQAGHVVSALIEGDETRLHRNRMASGSAALLLL